MDATKTRAVTEVGVAAEPRAESPQVSALVERAKAGDPDAFSDLMRLYERRVIALGMQMGLSLDDARDACQDAFVKVFKYIGRFRSGQSFFRWLHRIAINAVYDHLKWSRPPGVASLEGEMGSRALQISDGGVSAEARVESQDLARKLLAGLDGLSRQEKIVFVLRDLQEIPSDEIARVLRLSQVTVRRHCMSARQKLRRRVFEPEH